MAILVHWLNSYAEAKGLDLMCERLEGENVTLDEMKNCISKNGVAISRLFQECDHYALVTDIDDNFVYLFDPYYLDKTYYDEDEQVKIVFDKPFNFNRKVSIERFLSEGHKDFALGEIAHRECVLMKRTNGM